MDARQLHNARQRLQRQRRAALVVVVLHQRHAQLPGESRLAAPPEDGLADPAEPLRGGRQVTPGFF